MNDENEQTEAAAAPRKPKKQRLSEVLASMSGPEREAYLESIPVHATTTTAGEWRDTFSEAEEEDALRAAADARFAANAVADAAARFNWKF